jgi:hypothetical protein
MVSRALLIFSVLGLPLQIPTRLVESVSFELRREDRSSHTNASYKNQINSLLVATSDITEAELRENDRRRPVGTQEPGTALSACGIISRYSPVSIVHIEYWKTRYENRTVLDKQFIS